MLLLLNKPMKKRVNNIIRWWQTGLLVLSVVKENDIREVLRQTITEYIKTLKAVKRC